MTTTTHLLLLEDDISLCTVLADYLRSKGYLVDTAYDGQEGWEMLTHKQYDLLLTDISMPRMNGWQLLKQLHECDKQLPIIIVSAQNGREDIIRGYQLGCDDYVTKPYTMDILICKIEAVLRRYRMHSLLNQTVFELDGLHYDATQQLLGERHISSRENDLLLTLCQNMGKVVDRGRILTSMWGEDNYFNARTLSVYINHLRNYMGKDSAVKIMSVHGKGYKLVIMDDKS